MDVFLKYILSKQANKFVSNRTKIKNTVFSTSRTLSYLLKQAYYPLSYHIYKIIVFSFIEDAVRSFNVIDHVNK